MIRSSTLAEAKGDLPMVKLAQFGDLRTKKHCLRHNKNVLKITGIEGDYDLGEMPPEKARDLLAEAGVLTLVYTSSSHMQPGKGNRWRVLAPCSRPLPPR